MVLPYLVWLLSKRPPAKEEGIVIVVKANGRKKLLKKLSIFEAFHTTIFILEQVTRYVGQDLVHSGYFLVNSCLKQA